MTDQNRYIPNSAAVEKEMLAEIGVNSFQDILAAIPGELQAEFEIPIGTPLTELELSRAADELAGVNNPAGSALSFLGGGSYDHFVPSIIPALVMRSEFYTAYTPYQAEVSQGTLQAMYEYQSMICQISDMDVANASLYDGASAVAEACLMAMNITRKSRLLVSAGLYTNYLEVVKTYLQRSEATIDIIPENEGLYDQDYLKNQDFSDVAAVIIQSPNRYGLVENWSAAGKLLADQPALFITVGNPLALGMFATPGECDADIYAGEGQVLGNGISYGGPGLGLFATRQKHVRKMPGRIIGATTDVDGKPGFVLALQTREQHIRRERATSNICTNQGLMALTAAIYLSLVGKTGFRKLAEINFQRAHYCAAQIDALPGFELKYGQAFFNEFVIQTAVPVNQLIAEGNKRGIMVGDAMDDGRLLRLAVTEKRTGDDIDKLVDFIRSQTA